MAAAWLKNSDLSLDEGEAEKLALRINNVARHYDTPKVAQKTKDIILLIQAAVAIEGPRLMSLSEQMRANRAKPVQPSPLAPRNVAPAPTAPNQPAPQRAPMEAAPGPAPAESQVARPRSQPGLPDNVWFDMSPPKLN